MNKALIWKTIVIAVVLVACVAAVYPPGGKDFLVVFEKSARNQDAVLQQLIADTRAAVQDSGKDPGIVLRNLAEERDVDLTRYFPKFKDNRQVIAYIHKKSAPRIRLGLDLRGGTEFVLRVKTEEIRDKSALQDAPQRALEIIRNRVDQYGLAEPEIYREGADRIIVKLPGVSELEKEAVRDLLKRAAYLEFRMVHESNDWLVAHMKDPDFVPPAGYEKKKLVEEHLGEKTEEILWVEIRPELTGQYLKNAGIEYQMTGTPYVTLSFNRKGAILFANTTRKYAPGGTMNPGRVGRRMAIVLDGKVYSAPVIEEEIPGGEAIIRGSFSQEEAQALSIVLRSGALPAPIEIIEERGVDPSLGRESVRGGLIAGLSGMALVMVFVLVYYMLAGMLADGALIMNIVLIFGVLALFRPNLTLPGIAGIILTIGMAVDANVLIYERIREEQAAAKRIRSAIFAGYEKAFSTIFDANVTTLLTAVILGYFGSGPVRGFAITLSVGILASMFTALVVTRVGFEWLLEFNLVKRLRMLSLIRNPSFDFLGKRKLAFGLSLLLIVVGMVVFAMRGDDNFGVDFTGGVAVTFSVDRTVPANEIEKTLVDAGLTKIRVQYKKNTEGMHLVEIRTPNQDEAEKIDDILVARFPDVGFSRQQLDIVGATVGKELRKKAVWAMALSLVGILIYISWRFEFAFAIGAIVALAHDVLITLGAIAVTGRYLSLPLLAALLTIIGYSLNDTIVVFDRIREDMAISGKRKSLIDLMNQSINETLSRTLITSLTTLLVVLTLYLFGGGVINDFAFALLVGIVVGTYSSIFVASPVVLLMHREKKK